MEQSPAASIGPEGPQRLPHFYSIDTPFPTVSMLRFCEAMIYQVTAFLADMKMPAITFMRKTCSRSCLALPFSPPSSLH